MDFFGSCASEQFVLLIFTCIYVASCEDAFLVNFRRISNASEIGNTLLCGIELNVSSLNSCKRACTKIYYDSTSCPALLWNPTAQSCHLCDPTSIEATFFTTFNSSNELYVIDGRTSRSNLYIPMESTGPSPSDITVYGGKIIAFDGPDMTKTNGIHGNALQLSSNTATYAKEGHGCFADIDLCNNGFSVSLWFKASSLQNSELVAWRPDGARGYRFWLTSTGKQGFNIQTRHMNYAVERDNPEIPYEPNRWVMLTGTFTTNMQVIYKDGQLKSSGLSAKTAVVASNPGNHKIGKDFEGVLDELKFFNRELRVQEVWLEYVGDLGLVAAFPFIPLDVAAVTDRNAELNDLLRDDDSATCVDVFPANVTDPFSITMVTKDSLVTIVTKQQDCRQEVIQLYKTSEKKESLGKMVSQHEALTLTSSNTGRFSYTCTWSCDPGSCDQIKLRIWDSMVNTNIQLCEISFA